eukprot:TRINITY_DN16665_c0_g1_i3.p1 TRINITY_DN16665_c0_g1~~TRINITY_DN16665_c0_g1_i3.p1  ORF type:complete len:310 (+),score=111.35 TRINITY_DN16665_c0_g1_i3:72-1001(+)
MCIRDSDELSPRSRRRSMQMARMEKLEHSSASMLQAVLLGMATRKCVTRMAVQAEATLAPLDCSGVQAMCSELVGEFCESVHGAGELEGEAVVASLEDSLQQCATAMLQASQASVPGGTVQVLANVYVRRQQPSGVLKVLPSSSANQLLRGASKQSVERAQAEAAAAKEQCMQLELGMQELRLQLAHAQKRSEQDLRSGLMQRQQQGVIDQAVATAVEQQKAVQLSAAHEFESQLEALEAAKSTLVAEMPKKIVNAVTPLMERIKSLEKQLEAEAAQGKDIRVAWEMMTGKPYATTAATEQLEEELGSP